MSAETPCLSQRLYRLFLYPFWIIFFVFIVSPNPAQAQKTNEIKKSSSIGEFRLAVGLGAFGTEWRTDVAISTQLKLGYRLWKFLGFYGSFRLGYADVDQRVLTLISLGVQAWLPLRYAQPFLRVSLLHQHEESLSVIAGNFGSAILGIGEGIRHRGGVGFGLGVDIPVFRHKRWELFLTVEGLVKWFPGDMGPAVYAGGNLGFGFHYKT